jgi:hypothetical protein
MSNMSEPKEPSVAEVFRQLTDVLQKTLSRITEVEQHVIKDLESIRRQLDAVGVLKDNIANLNNRIDLLNKKLVELGKQEPQELSRLMTRAISELDKRMQMFTITEVLSKLEGGTLDLGPAPTVASAGRPAAPKPAEAAPEPAYAATPSKKPAVATALPSKPDAVAEATGTDQPWRESMREKYGLKKKPGSLMP